MKSAHLLPALEQLQNHIQKTHTLEQTLVRLVTKNVMGRYVKPLETALKHGNISVATRYWTMDEIEALHGAKPSGEPPFSSKTPPLVVHINRTKFLIDGHRRIASLIRKGAPGCMITTLRVK